MSAPDTLIPGHGVFKAYGFQPHSDYPAWQAFDNTSATNGTSVWWSDALSEYSGTGDYSGSTRLAPETVKGAYIVLEMPYEIILKQIKFWQQFNGSHVWDRGVYYAKCNPSDEWTAIHNVTDRPADDDTPYVAYITDPRPYKYFAIVITRRHTAHATSGVSIRDLQFFGTPGPTTLDKGSLTLGRSLDVPRISRYDVDTETPRPEKLVLDYDTTVKNDGRAADISGSGNDGMYYGHAQYSAADKAFKFDGTGDTVYVDTNGNIADTNLPTGDAIYTMSCWIKANSAQYGSDAALFYFGSAWTTYQLAGIYHGINGRINMDIGGHNMRTATGTIQSNRWYHIAIVKRGTGTLTSAHSYGSIYIDGVEIDPANLTYNAGGPQALQSIDNISIGSNFNGVPGSFGEAFNGLVSKPQIWNVALENSEIRKIYNLGRTGRSMVISDTAVGIGKVPEAQLDVRGSLNVTGNFNGNSPLKFYRFRLNLPLNTTGTSYIRRNDGAAGFPSDYDDTKIISISSVMYNHNGDVVMGQGEDTTWKHTIYSIPLHSGSSNAGLVIYYKGANVQSDNNGDRRLEVLVVTY